MKKIFLTILIVCVLTTGLFASLKTNVFRVIITDPTSGQIIHWDSDLQRWVNTSNVVIDSSLTVTETLEASKYNYTDATELTIATGAITVTQSAHTVDGESDASDNLDTITGGANGDYLILYPANSARDITIRSGIDNILTSNGINYTIPDNGMVILYYNGSNWLAFTGGSTFPMPNDTYATWEDNAGTGTINAIKVNTSDEIDIGATLNTGSIEFEEDSGVITGMDMPVSATPSDGDEMSVSFSMDSNSIWKYGTLADGAGGVDSAFVKIFGKLVLDSLAADPDSVKGTIWYGGGDDSLHIWTGAGKQTFQLNMAD